MGVFFSSEMYLCFYVFIYLSHLIQIFTYQQLCLISCTIFLSLIDLFDQIFVIFLPKPVEGE